MDPPPVPAGMTITEKNPGSNGDKKIDFERVSVRGRSHRAIIDKIIFAVIPWWSHQCMDSRPVAAGNDDEEIRRTLTWLQKSQRSSDEKF
jgi:hypothetical protein